MASGALAACQPQAQPEPDISSDTSLYALVQTVDGVAFYPPLGPDPGPMVAPFDGSLLNTMTIVLEATDASGGVHPVATFNRTSQPALVRMDMHQVYFIDVPAAAYFTDPSLAYRFRVLSGSAEIARSDLSSRIFEFLARYPQITVGVKVRVEQRPAPVLASLSPSSAVSSGNAFTLTVQGSSFLRDSVVRWNQSSLDTTFVSGSELRAAVPAANIDLPGSASVTVFTPAPGGGTSSAATFTITPSTPVLAAINPSQALRGGAGFTMTVTGSSFARGSYVRFGGAALATTFSSETQLFATVPASAIAAAGTQPVAVVNPGGGTSAVINFGIDNPAPSITALSPSSGEAGAGSFTLTIDGAGFVSDSAVTFGGASVSVSFISAVRLFATIPASAIATPGYDQVVVTNPAPGGGSTSPSAYASSYRAPTLTSIAPLSATAGGGAFTLTLNGADFDLQATASFNGTQLNTNYVSSSRLTATVPAAAIALAGNADVIVSNPVPSISNSATLSFTINNPVPVLSSLTPSSATSGGPGFTLTVDGANFVNSSAISFNGAPLATNYVSSTRLTASVPASAIATAGFDAVIVSNPTPGGGNSATRTFTVNYPTPQVSALTPSSATTGGAAFTLTVDGAGFVNGAGVTFDGVALTTTFVSATQLTAAVTAARIAGGGTVNVTVTNPTPTAGASQALVFTVSNPTPVLASITPASITVGTAVTITLNGSSFVSGAQASFNGTLLTTTYHSAVRLTAVVPASLLGVAGTANVIATNPAPGGGASSSASVSINNATPTLSSLSPNSATIGSASITMTVNGASFVTGAQATFNGTALATTFVSATRLTATVPSSLLNTAGTFNVTASNPDPSNGPSAALTFTVNNVTPTLSSLAPNSATAGNPAFTLTINGASFLSGAQATFNGTNVTTTFVSGTQLTAAVTAALIANGGTYNVTVTNPAPASGASAPLSFTVNNVTPVLSSVSPSTANAGGATYTITLTGTSFAFGATATFNGVNLTTTYVSATQLTAVVPSTSIATAGTYNVTVTNPAPGGGTSAARTVSVTNGVPVLSNISPLSATAGGAAFTLSAVGSAFVSGATVNFGGTTYPTSFVSSTVLTAAIPSSAITAAGNIAVTVSNPAPGGGTSGAQTFVVNTTPSNVNTSGTIGDADANRYAGSSVVLGSNAVLTIATGSQVNFGSLEINPGSSITSAPCTTTACYCAKINVAFNATVHTGATIVTDGKGYLGGNNGANSSYIGYNNGLARISAQSNYYDGGSHGGYGGFVNDYGLGFTQVYDDLYQPTLPGAGGNGYSTTTVGGNGGGCIHITVGGTLQVDGSISANGVGGSGYGSAGAGGSIWVEAPTIATVSSGVIFQANGGSSATYGSGGGGRIALYYGNATGWAPSATNVQAYGGSNSNANYNGGSGTIYYTGPSSVNGSLLLTTPSNRYSRYRRTRIGGFGTITALTNTVLTTGDPQIPGALVGKTLLPNARNPGSSFVITANTDSTITCAGGGLTAASAVGNRFVVSDYVTRFDNVTLDTAFPADTGLLDLGNTLDVRNASSLTNYNTGALSVLVRNTATMTNWDMTATTLNVSDTAVLTAQNITTTNLNINNSSVLTGWGATTAAVFPMTLTTTSMNVDAGASITLAGLGYLGGNNGANGSYYGLTYPGVTSARNYYVGGHHGGWGGLVNDYGLGWGAVYDDVYLPTAAGSGGTGYSTTVVGGNGGGALHITAAGTLTLNGSISVDGIGGGGYGSCGAGGSILINAGTISTTTVNTLLMHANGGSSCTYGSGGGGRIALYYDTLNGWAPSSTTVQAYGGSNSNANYNAGSGTIFTMPGTGVNGNLLLTTPASRNSAYKRTRIGGFGTITALTSTVLTTADQQIPGALVGHVLVPNMYSASTYTITANTDTSITVASGGLTSAAAVGNRFYVADYATQFDNVTLDNAIAVDTGSLVVGNTLEARNTTVLSNFITSAPNVLVRNTANMTTWNMAATTYNLSDSAQMTAQNITSTTLNVNNTSTLRGWGATTAAVFPMSLTTTNMNLDAGATITLAGLGYLGGNNGANGSYIGLTYPGVTSAHNYYVGGHHGGWGGLVNDYGLGWGAVYDDVYVPTACGSGGTGYSSTVVGGNGGGAISINASGNFVFNGSITADGIGGGGYGSCGAGGSILIDAGTISTTTVNTLLMHANGGSSCTYGSGGGGRVAIYYDALSGWTPSATTVQAYGGSNSNANYNAGSGTIYTKGPSSVNGDLLLTTPTSRNSAYKRTRIGGFGTITALTSTVLTTADQQIPGALVGHILVPNMYSASSYTITANTDTTITVASGGLTSGAAVGNRFYVADYATAFDNVTVDAAMAVDTGYLNISNMLDARNTSATSNFITVAPTVLVHNTANMTTWNLNATTFNLSDGATMTAQNITATANLGINNTAALYGWPGTTTAQYPLTLTADSMNLDAGARINMDGRGYLGGNNGANGSYIGYYNGGVLAPGRNYYMGGAHGGVGGYINDYGLGFNTVYGSNTAPITSGAGGNGYSSTVVGGNGGGVIRVNITHGLTLVGLISANGQGGSGFGSGGAGGSVWISGGTITGPSTALVASANGGAGVTYGRGGGGRVAVRGGISGWTVNSATVQANGGTGGTGTTNGANGSVYGGP